MTIVVRNDPWIDRGPVVFTTPPQALNVDVPDNIPAALHVFEGSIARGYLQVRTVNGTETITYGHASALNTTPSHLIQAKNLFGSAWSVRNGVTGATALNLNTLSGRLELGGTAFVSHIRGPDNRVNAILMSEAGNNYLAITTTNGAETVSLGNVATDPEYFFLGSGRLNVTGGGRVNYGTDAAIAGAVPATLGTTGGATGPSVSTQDSWLVIEVNGAIKFIPLWD